MRLDDEQASSNVEDRRGQRGGFGFPGGGRRITIPMGRRGGGGIGIGGIIVLLILMWLLGINPLDLLTGGGGVQMPHQQQTQQVPSPQGGSATSDDAMKTFVAKVLGTTERTWTKIFQGMGRTYKDPRLVLYSGYLQSGCGMAQSAMGPFYCPLDQKVYIDLSFYRDMKTKLGAPGDFAQAYVIAHEIGHHVQNLLGIAEKVTRARMQMSKADANALSVRMELQADCFAGIWAHDNQSILEQGDIEEGLNAASAIGDDRLQRQSQGYVVPDSFTHGTSAQRVRWFKRGLQSGQLSSCDTFGADQL